MRSTERALNVIARHDLRRATLMGALDRANNKWGLGIGSADIQGDRAGTMHRSNLSPCYTTRWDNVRSVS